MGELGIKGRVAAITAGWREREAEDDELANHLGGRSINLGLYQRSETLLAKDRELNAHFELRKSRLHEAQALYRFRLNFLLEAARAMIERPATEHYSEPETAAAIEDVRRLDRDHLARVAEIQAEFEESADLPSRSSLSKHRRELRRTLDGCEALAIAGGHVAVLINRLRIFDVIGLLGDKPIIAWSAGAMALSPRVILYHDFPPQGAGNAEVLETGLELFDRALPLPHARRRLDIDNATRITLFARRFEPHACVAMDEGAHLVWDGQRWTTQREVRLLMPDGSLLDLSKEPAGETV